MSGDKMSNWQATGAAQAKLSERRTDEAMAAAVAARERLEVIAPLTVAVSSTGLAAGKTLLRLEQVSAGYSSNRPVLADVSLTVTGPERIALTGRNGAGKSTLLKVITGALAPLSGSVQRGGPLVLLDQDLSLLDADISILRNFRRLNPHADENACRAALARFRFRADAALQTVGTLSGGQRIRAALACVLGGRPPPLLVLDEPTNHLDLESVEAVEAGLATYDGALLVVSHDEAFLAALGVTRRIALTTE